MKVIDHNMLQKVGLTPQNAYKWAEEVIAQKEKAVLPPKISMQRSNHVFYNVMPCILPGIDRMGVKIITRHPEKKSGPSLTSHIFLYELSTGNLIAIMDGSYITAMRTGAVAAHSVLLFSNSDFSSVGIIGLGITATATMDVLTAVTPKRELEIHLLRYKKQAERFSRRYAHNQNLHFVYHDTPESVICSSEVIISCVTYADQNLADITAYRPGCVVIPVHTMGFQNCDTTFDKVFVDDIGHVKHFRYFDQFKSIAEVSAVIRGEAFGRQHKRERILVYNIGIALHDIYFANKMLEQLPTAPDVDLCGPTEKMWLM